MSLSFLKNPLVLGLLAAGVAYGYLYWENKKAKENNKTESNKEESVSFIIPMIIGLVVFVIAYNMFGYDSAEVVVADVAPLAINLENIERLTDTFDSNTYHIIDRGSIKLPHTDVFIDIAKF